MSFEFSRGTFIDFATGESYDDALALSGREDAIHPWVITRLMGSPRRRTPHPLVGNESFLCLPEGESLDPHQIETISYCLTGDDTLVGDDAGLGKTISMIATMNAWDARHILIVCPAVVKYNWRRELQKWWKYADTALIHIVEGDDIAVPDPGSHEPFAVIINYDILNRHKKVLARGGYPWDTAIFDESHRINNDKTDRTRAAVGAANYKKFKPIPARKRLFASATALNKPKNLWVISKTCDPKGLGDDWFKFHRRYCNLVPTSFGYDVNGASNLAELGTRMRASFYIRHDDSVLGLKPYVEDVVALPRTKRVKDTQANMILAMLGKAEESQDEETLSKLEGLRYAVSKGDAHILDAEIDNALRLVADTLAGAIEGLRGVVPPFEFMSKYRKEVSEDKVEPAIDYIKAFLEDNPEEPLLVFAHHKEVVAQIVEACKPFGKVEFITGAVKAAVRDEIKERFQKGETRVIVANLFAGGEGITLTRANRVIFVETDWNATTIRQCFKRVHRRGQTRPCHITYILMDQTVDIYVASTFLKKRAHIDEFNHEISRNSLEGIGGFDTGRGGHPGSAPRDTLALDEKGGAATDTSP